MLRYPILVVMAVCVCFFATIAQDSPISAPCGPIVPPATVPPPGSDGLYRGPFFDSHIHRSGYFATSESLCRYLEEEETFWGILLNNGVPSVNAFPHTYAGSVGPRIIPLLGGGIPQTWFSQGALTADYVRTFIEPKGPYSGIGEIGLYLAENGLVRYTSAQFQGVLQAANEIRGVVMIHPRSGATYSAPPLPQDAADLEVVLQAYPNVIFLLHGASDDLLQNSLLPLVSRYPNLYYTHDTNNMLIGSWGNLISALQSGAEQFVASVNTVGLTRIIDENVNKSRNWFERYPDRILWGTDRSQDSTWDPRSRDVLMQLSRAVTGRLPVAAQEAYAFRNALRVFGGYFSNPSYLAQFANGEESSSSIVLTNPSTTATATGSISLFHDSGQVLPISLNGSAAATMSSFTISPLGSATFNTNGAGTLVSGSARVRATIPLSTVVRFRLPGLGIAGVGESAPLNVLTIPVLRDATRGLNTGLALVNPDPMPMDVLLSLQGPDGFRVNGGVTTRNLEANGHLAAYVSELFPGVNTTNFQGTLTVARTTPGSRIAATALQLGSSPGDFTTLPAIAVDPATTTSLLVFPQFANGAGLISSLVLINPQSSATSGDVTFFDDDGAPLTVPLAGQSPSVRIPFSLPARGSVTFQTSGGGLPQGGSARVTATNGIGGVLKFYAPGLGIAGVGSGTPSTGFITPVTRSVASGLSTGVAITAAQAPVTLRLTLKNQLGQTVPGGEAQVRLLGRGHAAQYIEQLFPDANTAEFAGTLSGVSITGGGVTAMAIQLGSGPGDFTTLPVAPLR